MEGLCCSSCVIFDRVQLLGLIFDYVFCLLGSLSVLFFGSVCCATLVLVGVIMEIFLEIYPPKAVRSVSRFSQSPWSVISPGMSRLVSCNR
jgi:hypothetical protein